MQVEAQLEAKRPPLEEQYLTSVIFIFHLCVLLDGVLRGLGRPCFPQLWGESTGTHQLGPVTQDAAAPGPRFAGCQHETSVIPGGVLLSCLSPFSPANVAMEESPAQSEDGENPRRRSPCFFFLFYIFLHVSGSFAALSAPCFASSTFAVLGAM